MSKSPLMTPRDTAEFLGISLRTLVRWTKDLIGPPRLLVGRTVRYRIDALIKWLEEHEAKNSAAGLKDGQQ
ncbi:helix-turn-helix domain-containing protein [Leisingera sp. D0M16]|uniref:helix-turn-helix domain-containing protein n=1 Tax=Leisingera coralii TaxID=3351347 RepID=UPI003B797F24